MRRSLYLPLLTILFFQAEDGIRDPLVTGVQTCALPISLSVAKEKNVSAAAIRVVSDRFDEDMPADISATVDERGRVKIGGVVKLVATHPLQLDRKSVV